MGTFVDLATRFGIPLALVCLFIWHGAKREERMATRLNALEDFIRGRLTALITDDHHLVRTFTQAMLTRPCLVDVAQVLHEQQQPTAQVPPAQSDRAAEC